MYVCLEYQSISHDKINSAFLKKSAIPLMFQALKVDLPQFHLTRILGENVLASEA